MTHMHLRYMLFSLGLWYLSSNVFCFEADSLNSQGDYTHTNITRGALDKAAAYYIANILEPGHYNLNTQTTDQIIEQYFSKDRSAEMKYNWAVNEIVKGIANAFLNAKSSTKVTMNNEMIAEGIRYLYIRRINIDTLSKTESSWTLVREKVGELLFTLQDFYSNTNWIEMGKGVLHDLGWKSTITFPFARADQPTCDGCRPTSGSSGGDCHGNLLVNNVLTSGYLDKTGSNVKPYSQQWVQGQGKCSHGGKYDGSRYFPATGGINKESSSPIMSPHYYLHLKAGKVATEATIDFLIRNETSLLTELGYVRFGQLLGLESLQSQQCVHCNDPSVSMAFVFDTTGSMGPYIHDAKSYAIEIVTKAQMPGFSPANYILVTFNDPASETTYKETTNGEQMISWLNELYPHGGDDCPEYSMSGLTTAMKYSRDDSCVFLFTDADPKDPELQSSVMNLMQTKHLHLVSVITGQCDGNLQNSASHNKTSSSSGGSGHKSCIINDRNRRSSVIRKRRSTGNFYASLGGTFIPVPDKDILKPLNTLLEKNMDIVYVNIFNTMLSDGDLEIVVDSRITAFTVKIERAFTNPDKSLFNPNGTMETFSGKSSFNDIGMNSYIMSIVSPIPGKWILKNIEKTSWNVTVKQQGDIEFTAKLLTQVGESVIEVVGNPTTGAQLKLKVEVVGLRSADTLTTGILMEEYNRREITRFSLTTSNENRQRVGIGNITIPNIPFRVAIEGVESGHLYRRELRDAYKPSSATLDIVTIEDTLYAGKDNEIKYVVTNHGLSTETFTLKVFDSIGLFRSPKSESVTIASGNSTAEMTVIHPKSDSPNSIVLTVTLMLHGNNIQQQQKVFMIQQKSPPTVHIAGSIPSCSPSSLNYFNCTNETLTISLVITTSSPLEDIYTKPTVDIDRRNGNLNYSVTLKGTCCQPAYTLFVVDADLKTTDRYFDFSNGQTFSSVIPDEQAEIDIPVRNETGKTAVIYYAVGGTVAAAFCVLIVIAVVRFRAYSKVTHSGKKLHHTIDRNGKPRMPKSHLQRV